LSQIGSRAVKRHLPPLTALRSFEATARHLSVTKAADELFVTQAAVSHQIKILSDFLGVKLFRRQGNAMRLTEDGRKIYAAAQSCFDTLSVTVQEINRDLTPARIELRVRLTQLFSIYWLAPRLSRFAAQNPDIELVLVHQGSPVEDPEGFDVIIGHGRGGWRGYYSDVLFSDRLVPMCRPSLASSAPTPLKPQFLTDHVLIFETSHDWWADWFVLAGMPTFVPSRRVVTDGLVNFAVELALFSDGFILESSHFLRSFLETGRLVTPFDPNLFVEIDYYVITTPTPDNSAASRFRDWILLENANTKNAND